MSNNELGLLIDTDFCTGCHACEVACKKEHNLSKGVFGIKIMKMGPFEVGTDEYEYRYAPVPGKICDLCTERRSLDKTPLCVQSCPGKVMDWGPLDELAEKAAKKRGIAIWSIS